MKLRFNITSGLCQCHVAREPAFAQNTYLRTVPIVVINIRIRNIAFGVLQCRGVRETAFSVISFIGATFRFGIAETFAPLKRNTKLFIVVVVGYHVSFRVFFICISICRTTCKYIERGTCMTVTCKRIIEYQTSWGKEKTCHLLLQFEKIRLAILYADVSKNTLRLRGYFNDYF